MFIRIEYNSDYFTQELTRFLGNVDEANLGRINTRSRDHTVDLRSRKVVKQFYQKFKFEAMKPFEMTGSSKVEFVNVSRKNSLILITIELLHDPSSHLKLLLEQSLRRSCAF